MTALAHPRYEPPALAWAGETATEHPWIWWVVFVFSFSAALAWASYCVYAGGSPDIEWQWYRFKVSCHR